MKKDITGPPNLVIRPMTVSDIDRVVLLEQQLFTDPWPKLAFEQDADSENIGFLIAEIDGAICGYAGYMLFLGGAHLINIAVASEYRGKSIAKILLNHILEIAKTAGCVNIFLDVRPSNEAAIGLYRKYGFYELFKRPNYYYSPVEDALVMVKNL